MADPKVIKAVKEYLHELSGKGIYISRCFLYGSHAKNTATGDSDIDIMLVSPLFDSNKEDYMGPIWLSSLRTTNRIEPLLVGEKKYQTDDMSPIIEVVRQEGIEIAA